MSENLLPEIEIDPADCRPGKLVASNLGNIVVNDDSAYVILGAGRFEIDAPSAKALELNAGDDRYHYYSETHAVEKTRNLYEGPGQIYRNLTESPALQQLYNTSTSPIEHGGESSMIGFGTVETYRNDSEMTIMNVTTPDHLLADGLVSRQVSEIDGCTVITTSGIGTGDYGWLNKTFSDLNWGADTASLSRETVFEETGKQYSPDPRIIPEDMSEHIRTSGTETISLTQAMTELKDIYQDLESSRSNDAEHQEAYDALEHPHVGRMFQALVDDGTQNLDVSDNLPSDPSERASVILQSAYNEFHERELNIHRVPEMDILVQTTLTSPTVSEARLSDTIPFDAAVEQFVDDREALRLQDPQSELIETRAANHPDAEALFVRLNDMGVDNMPANVAEGATARERMGSLLTTADEMDREMLAEHGFDNDLNSEMDLINNNAQEQDYEMSGGL